MLGAAWLYILHLQSVLSVQTVSNGAICIKCIQNFVRILQIVIQKEWSNQKQFSFTLFCSPPKNFHSRNFQIIEIAKIVKLKLNLWKIWKFFTYILLTSSENGYFKLLWHDVEEFFCKWSNIEDHLQSHIFDFFFWWLTAILYLKLLLQFLIVFLLLCTCGQLSLKLNMRVNECLIEVKHESVFFSRWRQNGRVS